MDKMLSAIADLLPFILGAALPVVVTIGARYAEARIDAVGRKEADSRIKALQLRAEHQPDKVSFAWDLARAKLEDYLDRNLEQVKWIFWVAVGAMLVGFTFMLYAVARSTVRPDLLSSSYVAAISGVITEFIAVTFMVIYRSTIQSAGAYVAVLERINTVGMAVQILDSISGDNEQLKNATRAEIVRLLLTANTGLGANKG